MGFLDALFRPSKNTTKGFDSAAADFAKVRAQTDPFFSGQLQQGQDSSNRLAALLGLRTPQEAQQAMEAWQKGPGYQAALDAGQRQVDASAAGRGMLLSGDTLRASQQLGIDTQNQEYESYLAKLAGLGQGGYAGAQGLGANSEYIGKMRIGRGNAKDAGNQSAFGNLLGIAGTALGFMGGKPFMPKI